VDRGQLRHAQRHRQLGRERPGAGYRRREGPLGAGPHPALVRLSPIRAIHRAGRSAGREKFRLPITEVSMKTTIAAAAAIALLVTSGQSTSQQRSSQQQQLRANAPGGGVTADTALPAWPAARNPLDAITPVTDAMLNNPPAGEWLTWRRTYDDMGF